MLLFADFLARAHKAFREADWSDQGITVPPLEESHIFLLGEDQDFNEAVKEIDLDLNGEMRERIPMPFKDVSCCSVVRKPMEPKRLETLQETVRNLYPGQVEVSGDLVSMSREPVWILDRLIEVDESHPAVQEIARSPGSIDMDSINQWFLMVRVHGVSSTKTMPMFFAFGYGGIGFGGSLKIATLQIATSFGNEMAEAVRYIAAISHPANYVVRVTPKLTSHESRRMASGKRLDGAKSPHFIVVDHEVLAGMRRDPQGTHASPIPHERRGHWRRLAERCRHAKLLGKDKTFVRPSFIGERTFEDPKNLYEVLLDFGKEPVR